MGLTFCCFPDDPRGDLVHVLAWPLLCRLRFKLLSFRQKRIGFAQDRIGLCFEVVRLIPQPNRLWHGKRFLWVSVSRHDYSLRRPLGLADFKLHHYPSFRDRDTEELYKTGKSKRIPAKLRRVALKRPLMLNAAGALSDLLVPPGNKLEALKRNRLGQYSIRVNDQFRICFFCLNGNAHDVEVVDNH
jgi:proteic killer suppression protein